MWIRFGEFVLSEDRREVCRGTEPLHLTPKAMDLLILLIERRPAVVARQELLDRLWPDVIVSSANLKNLVSEIRNALGDHERQGRFIRSVHGRGYAFTDQVFDVEEEIARRPVTPLIALFHSDQRFLLWSGENIIGRSADCSVTIDSSEISRHHARVLVMEGEVTIGDLQSKNGTFVNGRRIEKVTVLEDGDQIRLGSESLTARISSRDDSTKTARSLPGETDSD